MDVAFALYGKLTESRDFKILRDHHYDELRKIYNTISILVPH